jgi:hypothetical protein
LTREISVLVSDGPRRAPAGGLMTRVVTLDEHGPVRAFLGWLKGIGQAFTFLNNVDESCACPTYDGASYSTPVRDQGASQARRRGKEAGYGFRKSKPIP